MKCNAAPTARTRGSILREAGKTVGKPNFSVKRPPLATLPADMNEPIINAVPPDVLHGRMRVGDKLIEGSIDLCAKYTGDEEAKGFEALVQSLGLRFATFKTLVNGKMCVQYTSFTGVKWRKLIAGMGPVIRDSTGVFPDDVKGKLASLYEDFHDLLLFAGKCNTSDAQEVARKANVWAQAYASMGWSVTPYIHLIVTHLPHSVKLFGGLDKLSGETVEAANDAIKRTHMRKTDHRSPKLTLQTQLRIELQEMESRLEAHQNPVVQKRKQSAQHPWFGEGIKERVKMRRLQEEEERAAATAAVQSPYADLSVVQLRELIFQKKRRKDQEAKS